MLMYICVCSCSHTCSDVPSFFQRRKWPTGKGKVSALRDCGVGPIPRYVQIPNLR